MILTAVSTEAGLAPQRFEARGGDFTIGRGADCDWTLPDSTRQLSKRHCRMMSDRGAWRVTDLSSNGMTLNDRAVTPGVSHPVRHGDRLGIGGYDITLSIETARAGTAGDDASLDGSPFGDGRRGGRLVGDPFVSPGEQVITDPFDVGLPPFFEDRDERPGVSGAGSFGDDVSALHEPFEPPRPGHLLLPADWDEPLRSEPAPVDPAPPATPFSSPFAAAPAAAQPPTPPDRPAALPFEDPAGPSPFGASPREPPSDEEPDTANVPRPARTQAPAPAAAPPARVTAAAQETASGDEAGSRAFAAFARGAGLDGAPQGSPEEALEKLGRAFRAYVVGLRRLLIARATVKSEFRIDRTMIRPFGNNPIKFATDDDDALAALLGIGRQVGMTAEQAVADSIRDVREHEMALTMAFHHGMRELVGELSPEQVAADLPPAELDALPVLRNSRRWKAYEARHARLRASLENSLDSVFGQAFARGYEAALSGMADPDPADAPPPRPGRPA